MTGHLLGAAGAVGLIYPLHLGTARSGVPPTINLDNPDQGRDSDFVPHEARQVSGMDIPAILRLSGARNGSLDLQKV
ncbi:hypothetical protein ACNKHQ_06420 [Shigella flexneri]